MTMQDCKLDVIIYPLMNTFTMESRVIRKKSILHIRQPILMLDVSTIMYVTRRFVAWCWNIMHQILHHNKKCFQSAGLATDKPVLQVFVPFLTSSIFLH